MFFRDLLMYRLLADYRLDVEALPNALAEKPARPCGSQELSTYGFVAPLGKGEEAPLLHACQGFLLLAARQEERMLPGSVVRDALQEKIEAIEAEQMRKVYKKEREQLKDEIVQEFLPRAFTRRKQIFAAIDPQAGLVFVNTSSHRQAEDLLSTLREVLGSLPVRPVNVKHDPRRALTQWVKERSVGHGLHLRDRAVLVDPHEDGGKIAATRQDLSSDEIQNHLAAGKLVTTLSLAWEDKLSFVIDDKLVIHRLTFEDLLYEQAEQDGGDDSNGQFDASFVLMMLTFREFVPALLEALGGEEISGTVSEGGEA